MDNAAQTQHQATAITEVYIPTEIAPWWRSIDAEGDRVRVVVDDPFSSHGQGAITDYLTAGSIHRAFEELAGRYLCCTLAITEEGYASACPRDADMILQHATFGIQFWG